MNGIIAAQIAVRAMEDQFTHDETRRPEVGVRGAGWRTGLLRAARALAALGGRRPRRTPRPARAAS